MIKTISLDNLLSFDQVIELGGTKEGLLNKFLRLLRILAACCIPGWYTMAFVLVSLSIWVYFMPWQVSLLISPVSCCVCWSLRLCWVSETHTHTVLSLYTLPLQLSITKPTTRSSPCFASCSSSRCGVPSMRRMRSTLSGTRACRIPIYPICRSSADRKNSKINSIMVYGIYHCM